MIEEDSPLFNQELQVGARKFFTAHGSAGLDKPVRQIPPFKTMPLVHHHVPGLFSIKHNGWDVNLNTHERTNVLADLGQL